MYRASLAESWKNEKETFIAFTAVFYLFQCDMIFQERERKRGRERENKRKRDRVTSRLRILLFSMLMKPAKCKPET